MKKITLTVDVDVPEEISNFCLMNNFELEKLCLYLLNVSCYEDILTNFHNLLPFLNSKLGSRSSSTVLDIICEKKLIFRSC